MNKIKSLSEKFGIVLCSALLGCAAYGQPSASVGISVPLPSVEVTLPSVEIHAESDFYEPLAPHGEWVVVGSYGRCWRPGHVDRDWRPYCNGNWQRTDAGWYWVSDEPWAWATYHYGRWDYTDQYGWYWVPQTQWAPAWVSWHEGGGYVGWAPLQPFVTISINGYVGFSEARISPRAFVFVEPRQFLNPIRPAIVVVNNTTIINKTKTVTKTKIVNNTVINEGPATAEIEKASGRKLQPVAVQELRHHDEAAVSKHRAAAPANEKKSQAPIAGDGEAHGKKIAAAPEAMPVEKTSAPREPAKDREPRVEKHDSAPAAKPEGRHSPAAGESSPPAAGKQIERQERTAPPANKPAPHSEPREKGGPDRPDKDHQNEPKP